MEIPDLGDYFRNLAKRIQSPIDFRVIACLTVSL
jgi:hypothetical protein